MLNSEQIKKLQAFIERYNAGARSANKKIATQDRGFVAVITRETSFVFNDKRRSDEFKAYQREVLKKAFAARKAEMAEFRAWKAAQAQKQAAE